MALNGEDVNPKPPDIFFDCHSEKQKVGAYVCLLCEKVFHKSCADRKSAKIKYLSSIFIVCSSHKVQNLTSNNNKDNFKVIIKQLQSELQVKDQEIEKLKNLNSELQSTLDEEASNEVQNSEEDESIIENPENTVSTGITEKEYNIQKIINKNLKLHNSELKERIAVLNDLNNELKDKNLLLNEKISNNLSSCVSETFKNTYAQATTNTITHKPVANVPNVIVTSADDIEKAYSQVKLKLKENKNVHINNLFKVNNKIILKCKTIEDNLKTIEILNDINEITAAQEELKNPKIKLVGIDSDVTAISNEDILDDLAIRNDFSKHSCEIIHKFQNKKNKKGTLLLRVNSQLYSKVMIDRRMYFGFNRCIVYDDHNVSMCLKCCRYGHTEKKCRNKSTCIICSGPHHFKECNDKNKHDCSNCAYYNNLKTSKIKRDVHHSANDYKNCPSYKHHLQKAVDSTDYPYIPQGVKELLGN